MAHVMSLVFFPMSIGFMSHVNFKKRPWRPVKFKGQEPKSVFALLMELLYFTELAYIFSVQNFLLGG